MTNKIKKLKKYLYNLPTCVILVLRKKVEGTFLNNVIIFVKMVTFQNGDTMIFLLWVQHKYKANNLI
jgi:hypothetical protein